MSSDHVVLPMNCNLLEAKVSPGQSIYYCPLCERPIGPLPAGMKPKRTCAKVRGFCIHLTPEIRQQRCPSCAGTVNIRVYGCELHGEATLVKKFDDIHACDDCQDYWSPSQHTHTVLDSLESK